MHCSAKRSADDLLSLPRAVHCDQAAVQNNGALRHESTDQLDDETQFAKQVVWCCWKFCIEAKSIELVQGKFEKSRKAPTALAWQGLPGIPPKWRTRRASIAAILKQCFAKHRIQATFGAKPGVNAFLSRSCALSSLSRECCCAFVF